MQDVVGTQQQVDRGAERHAAARIAFELAQFRAHAAAGIRDAAHEHALADEVGDEAGARPVIQVVGRVPLLDAAVVHDADFVGERERLVLVVGDQDRRRARVFQDRAHFDRKALAHVDVEIRERLVEQQQPGARRQRPCQRDALLLAAGELVRIDVGQVDQADQLEHRWPCATRAADAPDSGQAERDVAGDGEVREQCIVLEHHADAAQFGRDLHSRPRRDLAGQHDLAFLHRLEAGDAAQDRGLAASRRSEQATDRTGLEREAQTAHDAMRAVGMREIRERSTEAAMRHGCGRISG